MRKNYTQISNYFIDHWSDLGFTLAEKTIMEKWFRGQHFYVWHDKDLGAGISAKTVQRWREKMCIKKYCAKITLEKVWNNDTKKFYTEGYRYDFSPLMILLNEKDGNVSEQDTMSAETPTLSAETPKMSTHTNTIIKTYNKDYSSTTSSAKAVGSVSRGVPAVAGGIESLYNKYLPSVKIRSADREVLASLDQAKLAAFIPYLPHFDDQFWNSSSSTKQPCMLPAVWNALEKFVEGYPYSSAFVKLCKELKHQGVDVDNIIDSAENLSQGKAEIIKRYLIR